MIDIQVGDRVTYEEAFGLMLQELITESNKAYYIKEFEIIKIERIGQNGWYTVYEKQADILDEKEKEYLGNLLRPFKKDIKYIIKKKSFNGDITNLKRIYFLTIYMHESSKNFSLPYFTDKNMYKDMKIDRNYTLKELGLEE